MADKNKKSNAPGFGNGNGTLKQPKIKSSRKTAAPIPKVPNKSY